MGIQSITTDLYSRALCALPALTDEFKARVTQGQLALLALLLAFGLSQLILGRCLTASEKADFIYTFGLHTLAAIPH
jgi:hypothetical protein